MTLQFIERSPQGHRRASLLTLVTGQPPNAFALFAEVDQVKEKAERMSHARSFLQGKATDSTVIRLEQRRVGPLADLLGKTAEFFDGGKNFASALLLHHRASRVVRHRTSRRKASCIGV